MNKTFEKSSDNLQDLIVIGKGPAGISAAIYVARSNMKALVIGKDFGALGTTETIENYYGFPQAITGPDLAHRGVMQAERLGVEVLTQEVLSLKYDPALAGVFNVETSSGLFKSKAILIATGKNRTKLNIEGFDDFSGRGISFCAVCDGFLYRNKALALVGSGDYAASELHDLENFTRNITLFTDGLVAKPGIFPQGLNIVTEKIAEIKGGATVSAIRAGSTDYAVDGIFVAVGTASASDFAAKLGAFTESGNLVVNQDFMTNVPGLFGAGDCIGGFLQVAKAVSDGALAAKGIIRYIKSSGSAK